VKVPYSKDFDDIYYSEEGGMQESIHVFFEGNQLWERWKHHKLPIYSIGETGFGTGLNFLVTWNFWNRFQKAGLNPHLRFLYFISVEKFPLTSKEIQTYLFEFTELREQLMQLLDVYWIPSHGFYRFHFPKSHLCLQILVGEGTEMLKELEGRIDSWYLDGFNPKKNPELWNETIYREITRLSVPGASLATFTAASAVRRGLESFGWKMEKLPGFGKKREMSWGILKSKAPNPMDLECSQKQNSNPIAILGAGIAGASVAYALSLRNIESILYDGRGIAKGASGNPIGIFYPYLTKYPIPASRFSLQAFLYAIPFLKKFFDELVAKKGLYFLLDHNEKKKRYLSAIQSFALTAEIAEYLEKEEQIYFPWGMAIYPVQFVEKLIALSGATFLPENKSLTDLPGYTIVHCEGYEVNSLPSFQKGLYHPIKKVRGQLAYLPRIIFRNPPKYPICGDSYLSPWREDLFVAGSTYDEFETDRGWSSEDEDKILFQTDRICPFLEKDTIDHWKKERQRLILDSIQNGGSPYEGELFRVSYRAQTRDRVPMVGKIPEGYVLTGLGSRGLVASMLGGEIIASEILGEPSPLPISVQKGISPARLLKSPSILAQ